MHTPGAPPAKADEAWRVRGALVLAHAEAVALGYTRSRAQRRLLGEVLANLREATAGAARPPVALHLAPLVYAGFWGDEAPAHPLAAAMTLRGAGISLADALAASAPHARWRSYRPATIRLTASMLLHDLPRAAIATLGAPPAVLAVMHRTVAARSPRVTVARGPAQPAATSTTTPQAVEAVAASTGGEEGATAATMAALLAGASPRAVEACRRFGLALGTASELAAEPCADATLVERYCRDALEALAAAGLGDPARGTLRVLIGAVSSGDRYPSPDRVMPG